MILGRTVGAGHGFPSAALGFLPVGQISRKYEASLYAPNEACLQEDCWNRWDLHLDFGGVLLVLYTETQLSAATDISRSEQVLRRTYIQANTSYGADLVLCKRRQYPIDHFRRSRG